MINHNVIWESKMLYCSVLTGTEVEM